MYKIKTIIATFLLTILLNQAWAQSGFLEMVEIPAGEITMGIDMITVDDTKPVHQVRISQGFMMSTTEVTNAQAAEVFNWALDQGLVKISRNTLVTKQGDKQVLVVLNGNNHSYTDDGEEESCRLRKSGRDLRVDEGYEDYPLIYITWYGSAAFCNYLSMMEGLTPAYDLERWACDFTASGYRLPTEAEWVLAAWGGRVIMLEDNAAYHIWGIDWDTRYGNIRYQDDGYAVSAPVGTYRPNTFGLFDMEGNASEWCNDWYGSYSSEVQVDPRGPETGEKRMSRGSNWFTEMYASIIQDRRPENPFARGPNQGFRPIRP